MRLFYSICFLFFCFTASSQKVVKGLILDAEKNDPLANASVFLNTTSIGTITNTQGAFTLTIPNGKYELIVSSVGYETHVEAVNTSNVSDFITIKLKVKAQVLQTVVIEPYEKDGWEKWSQFFLESFIGTSSNAKECTIKNPGIIRFRNSKKTNELSAYAEEPLIIENASLGYVIYYQLETFNYNFKSHYLMYTGYPFFKPMKGNAARQKKWTKKREEAYQGSMLHFMRAVYRNKIAQEGFEIRTLEKIPNREKQRVKAAYPANMHTVKSANGTMVVTHVNKDSADLYDRILRQDDYKDVVGKNPLPGDSIAYAVDPVTAGFDFKNYLLVLYRHRLAPPEYRQQFPKANAGMMSQIFLLNEKPVEIQANGAYYNPADLMTSGYWAWSEKIALLLPFDYTPLKKFERSL